MQIDLSSKSVKDVLLYGCEIWGYGNIYCLEKVQLKVLKYILRLKSNTPNCIKYGENGVNHLSADMESKICILLKEASYTKVPEIVMSDIQIIVLQFYR